ncbi:hypothetical protein [Anaerosolibacter sp.]|jgi:fluoroquinolone transport system permease protein|uniref:hypothetical protein n=1 Tax=Anaerosolibacter sp. TaxID=1872527 RepID=UPI00260A7B0F|nr:hypothetical protein [Anaerosolibacter sp.]
MKKIYILLVNDLRNILREPMLSLAFLGPFLLSLAMRWMLPSVTIYFANYVDLTSHYPLIFSFMLLLAAMLTGMVTGFLLLDERDDQIYMTLIVTPLGKEGYTLYRIIFPMVISFFYAIIALPIAGVGQIPVGFVIPIGLLAALEAPIMALFLACFAGNKVEGLALSKGFGLLMIPPIAAYFTDSKWQLLAGISPFYWPVQAFLAAGESGSAYWFYIFGGILIHSILLYGLTNRFIKKMG